MARTATLILAAALTLCGAAVALAAGPLPTPGIYYSVDHPGSPGLVLTGRGANSWTVPHGNNGIAEVFNSMSFDGATLGTQWTYACGIAPGAHTVQDNRVGGVGTMIYTQSYFGGRFFLSKSGPWGDGVNDWLGTIGTTTTITTVQYILVGGVSTPVASRVNINSAGLFDNGCSLEFVVANGTGAGDTDMMPKPAGWPDFIDEACAPTRIYGSWGYVQDITLMIDCETATRPSTWGQVKTLYR